MAAALIVPPAALPVSLAEAKKHLRVETDDDDQYLTDLIASSLAHLEAVSGLHLITQTWRVYFDTAPDDRCFRLPLGPVQLVSEMRVFDAGGGMQTVPLSDLVLDGVSSPARLEIRTAVAPRRLMNGIEIDLVTGFGDTAVDVPDSLRRALLLLVAHNYEFRGAVPLDQQPASEPHGFQALIAPFRRIRL